MKQLFLAASCDMVIGDIIKKLPQPPSSYNLAFIPTAAEVETGDLSWLKSDKDSLITAGFNVEEFSVTGLTAAEIDIKLADKQIVFFSGGNTFYLLDQVIKSGCDEILRRRLNEGLIYISSSAGSMIVGSRIDLVSTIDDPKKAPDLKSTGLDIINICLLPHWGSPYFHDEYLAGAPAMYTESVPVLPLNNWQYLWVRDEVFELVNVKPENSS